LGGQVLKTGRAFSQTALEYAAKPLIVAGQQITQ